MEENSLINGNMPIEEEPQNSIPEIAEAPEPVTAAAQEPEAEQPEVTSRAEAEEPESEPTGPCSRCNGDGFWHTTKTGARLATMADNEFKVDKSKACPDCKGGV